MKKYVRFIVLVVLTILVASVATVIIIMVGQQLVYAPGPSACPDPGQCTCNPATGVMTDHVMPPPFNRINNGCTEEGWF